MDATFLATLRQLFPRVTFSPPSGETTELGAVLDVSVRDRAIVVTLEHGGELRFYAGMPAWRVLEAHLRTGDSEIRRSRARATPPRGAPRDVPRPLRRLERGTADHERSHILSPLGRQR